MTLGAGSRLGPYEVLAPLGSGGMGEVYRARDTRLAREVAIKVLPEALSSDASRLKRFEKEARSASALNHPNIVTIYDIGSQEGVSYIAMELVSGKTLRKALVGGALPVKKLLGIGTQIAEGLAKANEAGIVHRDLKPENVMVTKDGLVKILDFGLAKLTYMESGEGESHLPTMTGTSPGMVVGTAGYMSPEQASGERVDFRSDQFSLGSMLYEMATGKRAFYKKTGAETLSAIITEEPPPIASVNPQAPAPLRWIVERCLAKDPEGRYASTRDLARELSTVRDHLSEFSVSGGTIAPARPRLRPRVAIPALALGTLVALAAGLFAGLPLWKARFSVPPTIRQLTFRRSAILHARFAPDGQVVYSSVAPGGFAGGPGEILSTRLGAFEPRSLGLPLGNIRSISSAGELAITVGGTAGEGTLATVPLAGGAPRELLENVLRATWAPDGKGLAVLHEVNGKQRIEFPIGRVLYEVALPGGLSQIEFSRNGDWIAFFDFGTPAGSSGDANRGGLWLLDTAGNRRRIPGVDALEYRWSPRGDEIWFSNVAGGATTIEAVTLSGRRRRLLASFPGDFGLHDVDRDGRVLLERITEELEIVGRTAGDSVERNLSWLDGSVPTALSADGKTLLFAETRQGGGPAFAVYKRRTDGSPAVRLGEGWPLDLSPDGLWALVRQRGSDSSPLLLLPTGPGQPRAVVVQGVRLQPLGIGAKFLPDGKRLIVRGSEKDGPARLFVVDAETGAARAIAATPVAADSPILVSPDGRRVASSDGEGNGLLFDVEGGPARPIPGLRRNLSAVAWCADGHCLFVKTEGARPVRVSRLDISSGRLEPWKEFSVADLDTDIDVIPTPDGNSYVYAYTRYFSDLFIVEGLK